MSSAGSAVQYIDKDGKPRAAFVTHSHSPNVVNLVVFHDLTLDGPIPPMPPGKNLMSIERGNSPGFFREVTIAPVDIPEGTGTVPASNPDEGPADTETTEPGEEPSK